MNWSLLNQTETRWGFAISPEQQEQMDAYLQYLYEANEAMNLTRVPQEEAVGRHLLDSLAYAAAGQPPRKARLIDVGTGAGLPGIPLQIAFPSLRMTLLDSHGNTVEFLNGVCLKLGLETVRCIQARAEDFARQPLEREGYDWVVARAVAKVPVLIELLIPLIKGGGFAIANRSQGEQPALLNSEKGAKLLGAKMAIHEVAFEAEQGEVTRLIAKYRKAFKTPRAYPRPWATILKQPLGEESG
ncbi:MAG: 16S rRNA (guanine(527)-N(7))-methyltransferase RsmG [Fimbriimonadia bacterium]|nr:16S rRNA (guanine(527)-N(7))-methyltransferase RsmG [Fimbriimonadia bacterium]